MLQLSQCKILYTKNTLENLKRKVAGQLHIALEDMKDFSVTKRSIDARKKPEIYYTYTVSFSAPNEKEILQKNKRNKNLTKIEKAVSLWDRIPQKQDGMSQKENIVVVGAGPAGLFSAYYLSLCGQNPILIERGAPMEERVADVQKFWEQEVLKEESNVSFGEGGAGTFSDGKLNTGVKDKTGRKQFVLETFVKFGAPEEILYDAKPHIGTDRLRTIIVAMREEMKTLGCQFYFHTKLTDFQLENNEIKSMEVEMDGEKRQFSCDKLILAIGHSARDTFSWLYEKQVRMSPKAFAIGARVQHRQEDIDKAQYGILSEDLPVSPYKCTGKTSDGRGVYSFCMCPGGYVVNASSEPGRLVVNGMSDGRRDSGYANSAIVVTVELEDFGDGHCLAGMEFQRKWEQSAFELLQGKIPVQYYGDFKQGIATTEKRDMLPCVKGQWAFGNLCKILPKYVANGMIEGIEQFAQKLHGFNAEDTLIIGVETRTSSPVRIERDEEFVSVSTKGLYPCGEGAGYAGGIMSAAMDGLRVAMKIQESL